MGFIFWHHRHWEYQCNHKRWADRWWWWWLWSLNIPTHPHTQMVSHWALRARKWLVVDKSSTANPLNKYFCWNFICHYQCLAACDANRLPFQLAEICEWVHRVGSSSRLLFKLVLTRADCIDDNDENDRNRVGLYREWGFNKCLQRLFRWIGTELT